MRNFQDTFETPKRSFICAFSICMTVPLNFYGHLFCRDKTLNFFYDYVIEVYFAIGNLGKIGTCYEDETLPIF